MKLAHKTALITGATGVIGSAIARAFACEGCSLILSGQSHNKLQALQTELLSLVPVHIFAGDVSQLSQVEPLFDFIASISDKLDIVVTAAGTFGEIGSIEQCDAKDWTKAIAVNLFGTAWCIKYALPLLKTSSSATIITFAGGGEGALPHFSSYVSSKGAVLRLTETLAQELAPYQISINAISPGLVNSGLIDDIVAAGVDRVGITAYQKALDEHSGQGQAVSPNKAAALAVWLASTNAHGLTGKNISAVWDKYEEIPEHLNEIMNSDIYNFRRIKPKDRGYEW